MFAGLGNYVVGPQLIIEKMIIDKSDEGSFLKRDEDFQVPSKDIIPRSITTPVPNVTICPNFNSPSRPTAHS